jgi:hypothetical protein
MTRRHTPEELLELIIPHLDKRKMRVRATKDGEASDGALPVRMTTTNPSLSLTLRERPTAGVLWKCFAGMSHDAVPRR